MALREPGVASLFRVGMLTTAKLMVVSVVAAPMLALGVPAPAAQAAYSEAVALMRAELWSDALPALDRAIVDAPDWPEAWIMRLRVRVRLEAEAPMVAAAARFDPGYDYGAARLTLGAVAKDCERALALAAADSPDRPSVQQVCDQQSALLRKLAVVESAPAAPSIAPAVAAPKQPVVATQPSAPDRQASPMQQPVPTQQAASEPPAQGDAQLETGDSQSSPRAAETGLHLAVGGRRKVAFAAGGLGLVLGGLALGLSLHSDGLVSKLATGQVANQAEFRSLQSGAGGARSGALVAVSAGGALLITGVALLLTGTSQPSPSGVTVVLAPEGAGVGLAGVWP